MVDPSEINSPKHIGQKDLLHCDYIDFPSTVKIGGEVFIDDGFL
jgi:pyruvate kinase